MTDDPADTVSQWQSQSERRKQAGRVGGSDTEKWATHVIYDLGDGRPALRLRGACDAKHTVLSTVDSWLGLVGSRLVCGRIRRFEANRDWTIDVLGLRKYPGEGASNSAGTCGRETSVNAWCPPASQSTRRGWRG
jgi:hypothetical protein